MLQSSLAVFLVRRLEASRPRQVKGGALTMSLGMAGRTVRAFGRGLARKMPEEGSVVDVAASVVRDTYMGMDRVQLVLKDIRKSP